MKLSAYLQDHPTARVIGDAEVEIRAVRDDSRAVEPGDTALARWGRFKVI